MRIRSQFILSIVFFLIATLSTLTIMVAVDQQLTLLGVQEEYAGNIQTGTTDLSYLSDNFFLYQEDTKLYEWKTKVSLISDEISKLNSTNSQQQTLVNNIKVDLDNTNLGFSNVVTFLKSAPRNSSVRVMPEFQTSWNQTSENYQSLSYDSSLLINYLEDQASQLNLINTVIAFVVFTLFGLNFIVNYLIMYRRVLKPILSLKAGTAIVGLGNLEHKIKIDKKDEVGDLAFAFNQMTTDLKSVTASKTELAKEITERKEAEGALRASEQRWATTLASIGDAIIAVNTAGEITFLNAEAEKLTGWPLSEALHKPIKAVFRIINEYTRLEIDNPVSKVLETGQVVNLANHAILVTKNGAEIPIDDSAAPIRIEDGKIMGVVLVFRDISERRQAETELEVSKEFNESIVESISEALLVIDPKNYQIVAANSEAYKELNLRKEDLIGKTCYQATHNSSTPCDAPHNCPLREVLVTGKVATANHVHFDKDQNKIYTEISAYPFLENEGVITKVVHVTRNVTERKKAEAKLKENRDRIEVMNEKLRVVGRLTRHDVRNKLSAVTGYAYLIKKKHSDQIDIVDGLGKMEQAVKDSVEIFEFARMYEQLGVEELSHVNVEHAVAEAATLFPGLTFKVVNDCHGLVVLADSFLRQLFYNLIDNTRKYGKKTSTVRVHYENEEEDKLKLVYEDDGVGISIADKLKLFSEGFSTGGSTGFGLFLIKKMMDVYGWQIQETGEPDKGAKFVMTIPKTNKNGQINY
jgi:PAS domain S-box-containing protein